MQAWGHGLKGLATYRPNSVLGSVLSVTPAPAATPAAPAAATLPEPMQVPSDLAGLRGESAANVRLRVDRLPAPVLQSLRWPSRPEMPSGNSAWRASSVSRLGGRPA